MKGNSMDSSVYSVQFIPLVGHKNSTIPVSMRNDGSEFNFKIPPGTHMLTITAKTAQPLSAGLRQVGDTQWTEVADLPSGSDAEFRSSKPSKVFVGINGAHVRLFPLMGQAWTAEEANVMTSLEVISLPVYSSELAGG